MKKLFIVLCCLINVYVLNSQIVINALVVDSLSGEPLPFANISLKHKSYKGTASNERGEFSLKLESIEDSISISYVGYRPICKSVASIIANPIIKLVANSYKLKEVFIDAGFIQAKDIVNNIRKKRIALNPDNYKGILSIQKTKTIASFDNIKYNKTFDFLFKKMENELIKNSDSTYSLPAFYSENVTKSIVDFNGFTNNEILNEIINGVSFLDNEDFRDVTDDMIKQTNFYNDYIPILGIYIPSPIGSTCFFHYKMYVQDSIINGMEKKYKIKFYPKNLRDIAFKGFFWVDYNSYSITEIKANLSEEANINFVKKINIHNTYRPLSDTSWTYLKKETQLVFDYNIFSDSIANLIANIHKVRIYDNYSLAATDSIFKDSSNINSYIVKNEYNYLHDSLFNTQQDLVINDKINSLKENSLSKLVDHLYYIGVNGFVGTRYFDIGPLTNVFTRNKIEGHKFRLGFRTNKNFSQNMSLGAFMAYGTRDEKIKYGANFLYKFNLSNYNKLSVEYWNDIDQIGFNDNLYLLKENSLARNEDNIVSSLLTKKRDSFLSERQQILMSLELDLRKGITQTISIQHNKVKRGHTIPFDNYNSFRYGELTYALRFSFKENYYEEYFHRIYFGNKQPIINLKLTYGQYYLDRKPNHYFKIHTTLKHRINIATGIIKYIVEAGMIFGKVPFPLLEIHRGNQTYGLTRFSFNMLNNNEFISDKYISIQANYQTNGFIFNRIPLLKKLDLRENCGAKILIGDLSNRHESVLQIPDCLTKVQNPYLEVSLGISNILKVIRIEYIWRITNRDKINIQKAGIKFRFEVTF